MTPDDVKKMVATATRNHSMNSARTAQSVDNRIGASDVGVCRSFLWRMIKQEERREEGDNWKAFLGTAIGDLLERAMVAEFGTVHTQDEVVCELPSGRLVPGHVDVWTEPETVEPGSVWDFKAKDGLTLVEREDEPDRSHRYQIALYHRALVQAEKISPNAPAFIVYVDRSGKQSEPVVKQVDVTDELISEIDDWINDAIYGVVNDQEPSRDRPYQWCEVACPFFDNCRGADEVRSTGLIEDPEKLLAVKMYREGLEMEKAGAAMKDEARDALVGVSGTADGLAVSWTHVNSSSVNYTREAYDRLSIRPLPKPKGLK